jgi:hypothetical protein
MPDTTAQRFTLAFGGNDQEAPFYGHEPTGERGVMVETHANRIRDGRTVEQWGETTRSRCRIWTS